MNRKELLGIFALLEANYEAQFAKKTELNKKAMVNLWTEHFIDKDYNLVYAAVNTYIATDTSGFIPNVGQINEQIRNLTRKDAMTEQEAFDRIYKAVCNSGYHAREEFEKLPPTLQRLVGSPNQLKEWAVMDASVFHSVVASNLMRSYKAVVKDEEFKQALPESVKQLLGDAVGNFKTIDGATNLIGEGSKE